MSNLKFFTLTLILIFIFSVFSITFAAVEHKSFVDEMVDNPKIFEEDRTDPFFREKREINRLVLEKSFEDALTKYKELRKKEATTYGELDDVLNYTKEASMLLMMKWEEKIVNEIFPYYNVSNYDKNELEQILQDSNTWNKIDYPKLWHFFDSNDMPITFGSMALGLRIARKNLNLCQNILGESHPITLYHNIALITSYSSLGDSKIAIEMAEELLPKVKQVFGEKSDATSVVLKILSSNYEELGNYGKCEETLLQAIEIDKALYGEENSPDLLNDYVKLIYLKKVSAEDDPKLYEALKKAAKNISESELYRLGYFQIEYSLLAEKLDSYGKEMKALYAHINDTPDDIVNYINYNWRKSSDCNARGIYQPAYALDLISLSRCRDCFGNDHHMTLKSICNLSADYLTLNHYENALFLAQEALTKSRKLYGEEHPCTFYAIHSLTNVYRKQGRYLEALALDQQAEQIANKIFVGTSTAEPLEILIVKEDLSNDHMGLGNYASSIKYLDDFLSEYIKNRPIDFHEIVKLFDSTKNLVRLYNLSGNYEKSLAFVNQLEKDKDDLYTYGLGISLQNADVADVFGDTLAFLGRNEEAYNLYSTALFNYEKVRSFNEEEDSQRRYFSNFIPTYKKATSFFLTQNKLDDTFKAMELCKGRTLADQYNSLLAMYNGGLSEEEILKLLEFKNEIKQYEDNFDKVFKNKSSNLKINFQSSVCRMNLDHGNFKKQLQEKYPKYKELLLRDIAENFELAQRKQIIPQNHCYITFLIVKKDVAPNRSSDEILACVVNDDGSINGFKIEVDEKFFDKCNLYHDVLAYSTEENKYLWKLADGNYTFTETRKLPAKDAVAIKKNSPELQNIIQTLSAELGEKLLTPLSIDLAGKSNLIISPDGELNNIPFETLQINGKMAIESANISYVPSFTVLKLMQDMKAKNDLIANRKELFAMGGAYYGENDGANSRGSQLKVLQDLHENSNSYVDLTKIKWQNLKGTEDELNKVSELFPTESQEIITGLDASEKNLKQHDKDGQLAQYKYILFAAHGMFFPEKPELTSIVLSQGLNDKNFDGYVTVGELFGYNLNSDLVYLSACESGLGDYQSGEGIIGLPYALTLAGNKDTVMSLWKIDDQIAPEFASKFFQKLKDGKTEIQALNETKREFLSSPNAQFNNPAVWSAFLLYGI